MSDPERPERRSDKGWRIFGTALAVVLVLAGLAVVGLIILYVVMMNSWGSNK